ncbi:lytic transglycosylase domain-containing protein [Burkholderia lata]|nr:lytic transglycosylase domain-containing protein [Burkholderia lata]
MTYMKALATAEDGFYPLGASGYWHGGIHFGEKTAAALKQGDGVCAIATGEVVAYRLDSTYPELTYNEPKQHERYALYSTGFVLVRHTLTLPPVPQKPGPTPAPSKAVPASAPAGASGANATPRAPATTPAPSSPPPDETLTFFSLYMHTLDWATYQAALKQAKAAGANSKATKLQPFSYWQTERIYRALKPNQQELPKPKSTSHPDDALECDMNSLLPGPIQGARVRAMPDKKSKIYGLLPDGSEVILNESDNGGHAGWAKISEVRSGTPVGPVVGRAPDANVSWGYVFMSDLALVSQSGPLDQVVVLTKPHRVKAGEVIAHIGQYQRYREAKPVKPLPTRPLLHLEVFAGPDLPAFINKSQARAKQLPDLDKPLLEILAGAKLVTKVLPPNHTLEKAGLKLVPVSDPKSRWVKVQPKTVTMPVAQPASAAADKGKSKHAPMKKPRAIETPAGDPFWVDGSLANKMTIGPVQGWKDFPLHMSQADGPGTDFRDVFRVADLDRYDIQSVAREDKDASGKQKRWWNITVGTKDGGTSQGWVREEDHPKVSLCSPWDWPGFELVDNSSVTPTEMFKRQLFVAGLAVGADQERFKTSADTLAASELIQKLEKAIDANHDGSVTAAELANAQNVQWSAEAISHMVVKSESEWGGNMAQWEALTPYMKAMSWKWQNEMERIKKLQWWEDIQCADTKILPKEPKPWHLHPIGLIGNFICESSDCVPLTEAQEIALFISAAFENSVPKFDGCAGNFDGMGMSFGLIQWNFGKNTLGPVLKKMHDADPQAFESAFAPGTDYQTIWGAISDGNFVVQSSWAVTQQNSNHTNWMKTFQAIGTNEKFQKIQIQEAAKYHNDILRCLRFLRGLRPDLMEVVQLVTYCALYDLCVQQGDLSKASNQIRERVVAENPATQIDLLKIAVQERAKTAIPKWVFDSTSRRMGIIQQKVYPHPPVKGEKDKPRENVNFKLLSGRAERNVCGL